MLVPHVRRTAQDRDASRVLTSLVAACSSSTTPPAADAGVACDAHQTSYDQLEHWHERRSIVQLEQQEHGAEPHDRDGPADESDTVLLAR